MMKLVRSAVCGALSALVAMGSAEAESGDGFALRLDGDPFNYTVGITPTPAQDYFVAPGETFTSTASAAEVFVNADETTRGHIVGYRLEELIGGAWQVGELVSSHSYTYTRGDATAARLYWVWSVTHKLTINPSAGGTVAGATSGAFFAPTEQVTLTATPSEDYEFVGWVGDVESADNPVTFTMDAPKTVIASFRKIPVVVPDHTEPVTYDWGWSNQVVLAGQVYSVLAYTTVGSASFTLPSDVTSLDYLVVAGGGGGGGSGKAGGGGAGGFICKTAESVTGGGTLSITVGAGGAGGGQWWHGQEGGDSSLTGAGLNETAVGGGYGAAALGAGGAGGSGGGAGGAVNAGGAQLGGTCTEGQGNAGGNFLGGSNQCGAGGGGAGGAGARAGYSTEDGVGVGGAGVRCNIVGTNVWYAAGGGGGVNLAVAPRGGSGIGGDGGANGAGHSGAANTGSGGGGAGNNNSSGGAGGSGIVIIRFVDSSACVHTWVEDAKVDETCETDGYCDEHCSKCGETRHRVLPAGHIRVEMTPVAPTATTTGLEGGIECSRCGTVLEPQTVVPKLCTGVLRAHTENRPVRVLVVGHSFSLYLAQSGNSSLSFAAHKLGEQVDVLALYRGSCSIDQHWGDRNSYGFYQDISSSFDSEKNPFANAGQNLGDWSLTKALETYDWDVILLHNSPGGMSMDGSYVNLKNLTNLFREKAPNAEVYFNLTWSFDRYYNSGTLYGVEGFGHDIAKRDEMYDRIAAYGTAACAEANVEIVPSGLAFQLYRYRKPVINDGEDIVESSNNDHQHQSGNGYYIMTWTITRRIFGKSVTPEMYPAVSDVAFAIACADDAANSYDYAHYGQGTVNFSWNVNFKTADGSDDIQSVTNRASAVIPAWAVDNDKLEGWTKSGSATVISSATIASTPVVEPVTYTPVWASEPPPEEPTTPDDPPTGETEEPYDIDPADGWSTVVDGDVVVAFTSTSKTHSFPVPSNATSLRYLIVGGGGGGGGHYGGGGGAGGYLESAEALTGIAGKTLTITVGAGGAGGASKACGGQGGDSSLQIGSAAAIVAYGGGFGGGAWTKGGDGGSGGGNGGYDGANPPKLVAKGVDGQGNDGGGTSVSQGSNYYYNGGGGGGAGSPGATGNVNYSSNPTAGGTGKESTITGKSIIYAKGGEGGGVNAAGAEALDGTGNGGGGGKVSVAGKKGGSGIVIIRYTVSGDIPIHTHSFSEWTTKLEPTCEVDGYKVRTCVAEGCSEPPYAETSTLTKLGHDWGEWFTSKEPQVGVAGERRRECQRTGCDAQETEVIPPLDPPTPTGCKLDSLSYIQKNLIAQWDGIENKDRGEHDSSIRCWKDLTGNGYDFDWLYEKSSFSNNAFVPPSKAIQSGAYEGVAARTKDDSSKSITGIRAFDIYLKQTDTNRAGANHTFFINFHNPGGGFTGLAYAPTGMQFNNTEAKEYGDIKNGDTREHHFYVAYGSDKKTVDSCWVDGVDSNYKSLTAMTDSNHKGNWPASHGLSIGYLKNYEPCADFYGIRVYSAKLTEEQAKLNYAIDRKRFSNIEETLPEGYKWVGEGATRDIAIVGGLTISEYSNGLVKMGGETVAAGTYDLSLGHAVTLTAVPDEGSVFSTWEVSNPERFEGVDLTKPTLELNVEDVAFGTVQAVMGKIEQVTVNILNGTESQTFVATVDAQPISSGDTILSNALVTVVAMPNENFGYDRIPDGWSIGPTQGAITRVFKATTNPFSIEIPIAAELLPVTDYDWGWERILKTSKGTECVVAFTQTGVEHSWKVPAGVKAIEYLVVGGGGGGGQGCGGGGGAGGVIATSEAIAVVPGSMFAITVGAGGAAGDGGTSAAGGNSGGAGGNSSLTIGSAAAIVADGGGYGGGTWLGGGSGGSGGGGGYNASYKPGTGIVGQGYNGSTGYINVGGGGGGGAGSDGTPADSVNAGVGGAGIVSYITGCAVTYAAGGNGGSRSATGPAGENGTGNGGGGGGYWSNKFQPGNRGGDGIVIIRYTISTEPQTIDEVIPVEVAKTYLDLNGNPMTGKTETEIREELKKKAENGYTFAENIELGIAQEQDGAKKGNFVNKPYLNSVGSEDETISFAFGNVTPKVNDAKITYFVESASSPSVTEWTQESSAPMTTGEERGSAALPSAESGASAVKYYRVRFTVEPK